MTETDSQWSDAVEQRIRAHLSAVDQALASRGVASSQRRSITDDVESQLREMVSTRSATAPTLADVEAVLAELDPPELYAEQTGEGSPPASVFPTPPGTPQPQAPAPPRPMGKDLILTIACHTTLLIILLVATVELGSHLVGMMAELKIRLPAATYVAVKLFSFVKQFWFVIAALFVVVETSCFLLFFLSRERMRTARKVWLHGVTWIMIALFVFWACLMLMYLPLRGLQH